MVRTAIPFGLGARLVSIYRADLSLTAASADSGAATFRKWGAHRSVAIMWSA